MALKTVPDIIPALKNYRWNSFVSDIRAGVSTLLFALPVTVALSVAAGFSPGQGIWPAILAGLFVVFTSSGSISLPMPTVSSIVIFLFLQSKQVVDWPAVVFLSGVFLFVMGLSYLGSVFRCIPYSILTGFSIGVCLVILTDQIPALLGHAIEYRSLSNMDYWQVLSNNVSQINIPSLLFGIGTILITILLNRYGRTTSGALIALIISGLVVFIWQLPVETVGTRIDNASFRWPVFSLISTDIAYLRNLIQPSLSLALVIAIEVLLSHEVTASGHGRTYLPNVELTLTGLLNMCFSWLTLMPVGGSIHLSFVNLFRKGSTPITTMISALILFVCYLLFVKWVVYFPLSAIAGLICLIAFNSAGWRYFRVVALKSRADLFSAGIIALLMVFFDIITAVSVAIILSALLIIWRLQQTESVGNFREAMLSSPVPFDENTKTEFFFRVHSSFFFGNMFVFLNFMKQYYVSSRNLVLSFEGIHVMDSVSLHLFAGMLKNMEKRNKNIYFADLSTELSDQFESAGISCKPYDESINNG